MTRLLFLICFFFSVAGSRLADGGLDGGVFRSLHVVDFLAPLIVLFVYLRKSIILSSIGRSTIVIVQVWLFYCFSFGFIMSTLSLGDINDHSKFFHLAPLFALKELEFLSLLGLGVIIGFYHHSFYLILVILLSLVASMWMIKELALPTGYYFIGLPFEGGAAQTGLAFAFLALNLLYINNTFNFSSMGLHFKRLFIWSMMAFLVIGSMLSLSRTTGLALAASCLFIIFSHLINYRGRVKLFIKLLFIISLCGIFTILFFDLDTLDIIFGRWLEFESAASDRSEKWMLLLNYQLRNPEFLLFGAGFNSPNPLVLGEDLGNILAVDNGYVRRLFELGIVGFMIYFFMIFALIFRAIILGQFVYASAALILFLFSALTIESFQVSQIASLFYLTIGVIIGHGWFIRHEDVVASSKLHDGDADAHKFLKTTARQHFNIV